MNKRILKSKETEIAKAGRLFFDAIFGDQKELERELEEQDTERSEHGVTIDVDACSLIECGGCKRELIVPPNLDAAMITAQGWKFTEGTWKCRTCLTKKETP